MLLYKNRKNSWLTALGNFDDMQNHCQLPMKNNITSKYLWKHSILYPFPMIFDIAQNVRLVIPMEKIRTPKKTYWWSIIDFNFDGRKKNDPYLKDINNEKNDMKNLHFTPVKHCFFSNSMILIDVLSGNLLPLHIYIYNPQIYFVIGYVFWAVCTVNRKIAGNGHLMTRLWSTRRYNTLQGDPKGSQKVGSSVAMYVLLLPLIPMCWEGELLSQRNELPGQYQATKTRI